ncbi:hypothetical protein ULVI_00265 [Cochleicola gelatinilyticus]|uniref:Uncharacterized protein n=1 Tax=Cochleicola gelatinilyticus TaxID=1763537 RepID=A0A167KGI1_9FLAO|nr:hypothetical protein ULVI_00265 [Cochleicola gelatinilyticus]
MASAKNATFLFHRNFMEYHSDRFTDHSLLVFKGGKLVAVLPANLNNGELHSHQGLTYGGLVFSAKLKMKDTSEVFKAVLQYLASEGIKKLHLKLLPNIYHSIPGGELPYLLQLTEAVRTRVDVSSTIDLRMPFKIQSNRTEGVRKAERHGLTISEGTNFTPFWNEILIPNLAQRHDAAPVHSAKEITMLAGNFPEHIWQFNVMKDDKIVAGATIFETKHVAHAQYISANADKQTLGSLDFLFDYLLNDRFRSKPYFDFGTSNEAAGTKVNEGLLYWKECFGARSVVHETYVVDTANYTNLEDIFI